MHTFLLSNFLDCFDDQVGFDGYSCRDYASFCNESGAWYAWFKASCRKTCNLCNGKDHPLVTRW